MSPDTDSPVAPITPDDPLKWTRREKWNAIAWLAMVAAIGVVCYFQFRESDEAKMKRLQSDQLIACFEARSGTDADANAKCALAQRKLNQFMNGR